MDDILVHKNTINDFVPKAECCFELKTNNYVKDIKKATQLHVHVTKTNLFRIGTIVPVYVFGQDKFSFWKIIKTASIFHGYLPIWRTKENVSSHVINVY